MMFDKDNTNFNGECLCESCEFGAGIDIPHNKHYCFLDHTEHKEVGVCKYYVEFNAYSERD